MPEKSEIQEMVAELKAMKESLAKIVKLMEKEAKEKALERERRDFNK